MDIILKVGPLMIDVGNKRLIVLIVNISYFDPVLQVNECPHITFYQFDEKLRF